MIAAGESVKSMFCERQKTIGSVLEFVSKLKDKHSKGVLLSIGETDLRNGLPLYEMKRLFTMLFVSCESEQLMPLVTTIMCTGPPELVEKANIFNAFIRANFTNVIDIMDVVINGLEATLLNLYGR